MVRSRLTHSSLESLTKKLKTAWSYSSCLSCHLHCSLLSSEMFKRQRFRLKVTLNLSYHYYSYHYHYHYHYHSIIIIINITIKIIIIVIIIIISSIIINLKVNLCSDALHLANKKRGRTDPKNVCNTGYRLWGWEMTEWTDTYKYFSMNLNDGS